MWFFCLAFYYINGFMRRPRVGSEREASRVSMLPCAITSPKSGSKLHHTRLAALDSSPLRACLTVRRSDRRRDRPVENYMACSHGIVAGTQPSSDSVDAPSSSGSIHGASPFDGQLRVMVVSLRQKSAP